MTATAAAAAAASQELSPFGKTPGVPRAGTKYPVQGNPSLRYGVPCSRLCTQLQFLHVPAVHYRAVLELPHDSMKIQSITIQNLIYGPHRPNLTAHTTPRDCISISDRPATTFMSAPQGHNSPCTATQLDGLRLRDTRGRA